ncbi:hypothetical protein K7X08_031249 [Anisodus acutangulus]|uniref:Exocyst subunit Exo70 family protein n=1 Tax=Anisodus acutangulus TaxID=402998 RepID=A0A9Q1MKS8_9SOLA|nr:hypothetical protein K7X08_031249 [Anisodus acutangulus]
MGTPRNTGGVEGVVGVDMLSERATIMRDSLQKSQSITDNVVNILGSFDHRLSALETAMRPTQIRTHAIRMAHETLCLESATQKGSKLSQIIFQTKFIRNSSGLISSSNFLDPLSYILRELNSLSTAVGGMTERMGSEENRLVNVENASRMCTPHSNVDVESSKGPNTSPTLTPGQVQELFHPQTHSAPSPYISPPTIPNTTTQDPIRRTNPQTHPYLYRPPQEELIPQMTPSKHVPPVLEESLRNLGVEKLSKDDVQKMQWEVLEAKIGNWIHFMRVALLLRVLLSFSYAIAKSKRSPEKLFVLLDMYEIMWELHSEIESLFRGKACNEIRESAFGLTKQLAQTAQETFSDFEEAVEKDATKTAVSDGTVHPLTSYVTNYVKFLFDYQSTLKQPFQEVENGGDSNSQLAAVIMRIMQALQTNLDGKSKQYKDTALTHLFLVNNIHYMVRSVRRSEAKDLLGDDWVQRPRRVVQKHANQYKRIAWAKILQCLSIQGLTSSGGSSSGSVDGQNSSGVSRSIVKDRLKIFNVQFEELHQRQTQWAVPDTELRESLRLAVAEVLLPAYRSFIKRFGPLVESDKNAQKYIRYSAEDLDCMLGEFFEGKTLNEPIR